MATKKLAAPNTPTKPPIALPPNAHIREGSSAGPRYEGKGFEDGEVVYQAPLWGELPAPLKYEAAPVTGDTTPSAPATGTLQLRRRRLEEKPLAYHEGDAPPIPPEPFLPLPVVGRNTRNLAFVPHYPTVDPTYTIRFDRAAYEQARLETYYERARIYDESEFHMPAELYRVYPQYQRQAAFVEYESSGGKFMYMMAGNVFWVNDAAELALLGERNIDRTLWESNILSMSPDHPYYDDWIAQRDELAADYHAKGVATTPSYKFGHLAIAVYDMEGRLLCVCRDRRMAEKETRVENRTISSAALAHKPSQGYYFRYFYDNTYTYDKTYCYNQYYQGSLVNRFRNLREINKYLHLSAKQVQGTYYNSGEVDAYGCTWFDDRELTIRKAPES